MDIGELEAEWHPTMNLPLLFKPSLPVSKKYWWNAQCGHEVQSSITDRLKGVCAYCSGKNILVGFNDLASQNPRLASQWHPTRNLLSPSEITARNSRKVWWLGECGHEWEARVLHRANGAGCGVCSGNKIMKGFNDLATLEPEIASQWHPTKNDGLTPSEVGKGGRKKVWWICSEGHEWETAIGDRVAKGIGCHYCSGWAITFGVNDLFTIHPHLKNELHPTKNDAALDISLERITSTKKVWWLGTCGHEWQSSINSRTNSRTQGSGCHYCGGNRVLEGFNDLASQNPALASEWHPTKNGKITPNEINAKSGKKYWWLGDCGHEWESQLSNRDNGAGCSVCAGKTVLIGFNDLASQNPALASQWHPTKNGAVTPEEITLTTSKKVWWICSESHEWEVSPNGRRSGSGCPYCSGNKVMAGFNDLETISPTIAAQWHPTKNKGLTPQQVTKGSKRKVWWLCSKGHEWEVMVTERNYSNCPICSGHKVLAGFNDLATLNPVLAAQWHPIKNGKLTPYKVTKSSGQRIWWICDNNHEWLALGSDRSNGSGCPNCVNHVSKAEDQIKEFLEGLGLTVEGSNRTILGGKKEIDLWIPSHKFGIEFNGIYWHSEKAGRKSIDYHHDKYLSAQKAGIQLVQLWEDDWTTKPEVVKSILKQKLGVAEKVLAVDTEVITATKEQAEEFLRETHLQGYASGTHYLGLVSKGGIETLRAIMVLEDESEKVLNIVRYATSANVVGGFTKLLDHATKTFNHDSFTATSDHCEANEEIYENNGFIVEAVLPPDYMYVVKNERKLRSEYPLERFRDDPKLLWEEGLTERELADLNGLDRIWDAGKTLYRLIVGK